MSSGAMVAILIGILAVVMVVVFLTVWGRDKRRSEKVADNPERLDTDNTHE